MARINHTGIGKFPAGPKLHRLGDGPVRLMARSGGYVMVRRPGCAPFVMTEKEWAALPDWLGAARAGLQKLNEN